MTDIHHSSAVARTNIDRAPPGCVSVIDHVSSGVDNDIETSSGVDHNMMVVGTDAKHTLSGCSSDIDHTSSGVGNDIETSSGVAKTKIDHSMSRAVVDVAHASPVTVFEIDRTLSGAAADIGHNAKAVFSSKAEDGEFRADQSTTDTRVNERRLPLALDGVHEGRNGDMTEREGARSPFLRQPSYRDDAGTVLCR